MRGTGNIYLRGNILSFDGWWTKLVRAASHTSPASWTL